MYTEGERIAKLEQHMVDQDNKLLEIMSDIKEIKISLQNSSSLNEKISSLENQFKDLRRNHNFWRWFSPTLTGLSVAVAAPILTLLILSYLNKLK